jgi:hypothetical protein
MVSISSVVLLKTKVSYSTQWRRQRLLAGGSRCAARLPRRGAEDVLVALRALAAAAEAGVVGEVLQVLAGNVDSFLGLVFRGSSSPSALEFCVFSVKVEIGRSARQRADDDNIAPLLASYLFSAKTLQRPRSL